MNLTKSSGLNICVVLLAFLLVVSIGPAVMAANTWEIDNINHLHSIAKGGPQDVPLSRADLDRDGNGGDVSGGDTIVLDFSHSGLQTESVVIDLPNIEIKGKGVNSRDDHIVYAGSGFDYTGGDGFNPGNENDQSIFVIREEGTYLHDFTITAQTTSSSPGYVQNAVLVTNPDDPCKTNTSNITFENLNVTESNPYGGSDTINTAFRFESCCEDYTDVTFKNVRIQEIGAPHSASRTSYGIHFTYQHGRGQSQYDAPYAVKNSGLQDVSIQDVDGVGLAFENGGNPNQGILLENVVLENSSINRNAKHGVQIYGAGSFDGADTRTEKDIYGFKVDNSEILTNHSPGTADDAFGVYIHGVRTLFDLQVIDSQVNSNEDGGLHAFATDFYRPSFINSTFHNNRDTDDSDSNEHGVFLEADGSSDVFNARVVDSNLFSNNDGHGFYIHAFGNVEDDVEDDDLDWGLEISGSSFLENARSGIRVNAEDDIQGVLIAGQRSSQKTTEENGESGVELEAGRALKDVEITEHTSQDNGSYGVWLRAATLKPGKIDGVLMENSTVEDNGDIGLAIHAGDLQQVDPAGKVRGVTIRDSSYVNNTNSGILIQANDGIGGSDEGDEIFIDNTAATNTSAGPGLQLDNDYFGDQAEDATYAQDLSEVTIQNGEYDDNDGAGILIDATTVMKEVTISGNSAKRNLPGIHLTSDQGTENVAIRDNTVNNNDLAGIKWITAQCCSASYIEDNTINKVRDNATGIHLEHTGSRCGDVLQVRGNMLSGSSYDDNIGIDLMAQEVNVEGNDIREFHRGIVVQEFRDNHINSNNIVGNSAYGVKADAGLRSPVDATDNWWGDPSGPGGNVRDPDTGRLADGDGDDVSRNVLFDPWATEAVVERPSDIELLDVNIPSNVAVDETVEVTFRVKNNTAYTKTPTITIDWDDGTSDSMTLSELESDETSAEQTFEYTYTSSGTFEVELTSKDDSVTGTIQVGGVGVEPAWANSGIPPITGDTASLELHDEDGNSISATDVVIKFYNLRGNMVAERETVTDFDTSNFKNGLFIYTVNVDDGEFVSPAKKVLVKKDVVE